MESTEIKKIPGVWDIFLLDQIIIFLAVTITIILFFKLKKVENCKPKTKVVALTFLGNCKYGNK